MISHAGAAFACKRSTGPFDLVKQERQAAIGVGSTVGFFQAAFAHCVAFGDGYAYFCKWSWTPARASFAFKRSTGPFDLVKQERQAAIGVGSTVGFFQAAFAPQMVLKNGGRTGFRTWDLYHVKVALYP